jgi:hypothetical protein
VTAPALIVHDPGCRWARLGAEAEIDERGQVTGVRNPGAGHSDAAKRFADWYNLHKAAGSRGWIAVALADGGTDGVVYDTRHAAIAHMWPDERRYFYCLLQAPSLTVCMADSLLRYKRIMNQIEGGHTDRDAPRGGLEIIPRLAAEDQEAQLQAVLIGRGHLALGYRR